MIHNKCITSLNTEPGMATNKSETMRFTDHASSTVQRSANPLESTFMLADTSDAVEGFFSRPQRIATFEWSPTQAFHEVINPWDLYFSNDKVTERLKNFSYLRCSMHVRVMINSTKFYYGRMMVSYQPMHFNDNLTSFRPGVQADFMEASQRPCVVIDPTQDEVGELNLPYMYPKSALLIPGKEWTRMGQLTLADLTVLRNANGATDPITVTVFAWAENVDYSQPTSQIYTNEGEYYDGPISKPAHSIARFANHLVNVPVIGVYAKATEMVASAGAAVARLFGYARPSIVESEHLYVPYFGKRLAATNVEDTADPLSLDIKKEVTVDPRVTGASPLDQMAFVPLAKRETYITSFDWNPQDAPDSLLFNIHVSPTQRTYETPTTVHTTPAGWIASLFRYWRGSMKLRFEVVCSSFHRGRLRLVYDPLYQVTNEYNVNYTHIMDLCSETDYTMNVGWAQNMPYIKVDHLNSGSDSYSTSPFSIRIGNGVLSVFVINALTTPSVTLDPVTVNVYASMDDDFEVQDPCGTGLRRLQVEENIAFPPPVTPADPPEDDVPPAFAIRGPVYYQFYGNGPYASARISKGIVADVETCSVIGGTFTSQLYRGTSDFVVNGLAGPDNFLEVVFVARALPGGLPDLTVDGVAYPWQEQSTDQPDSLYRIIWSGTKSIVNGQATIPIDWSTGPTIPLNVCSVIADRLNAQGVIEAKDDIHWKLGSLVGSGFDSFGEYFLLPPQTNVVVNMPGDTSRDAFIQVEQPGTIRFNDEPKFYAGVDFPIKGGGALVSGPELTITNETNGDIKLYSVTWRRPLFATEGKYSSYSSEFSCSTDSEIAHFHEDFSDELIRIASSSLSTAYTTLGLLLHLLWHISKSIFEKKVFHNEGAHEEEVQPERTKVEETAAGTPDNVPQVSDVFFGELPSSFRQIIKRYTLIRTLGIPSNARRQAVIYSNPRRTARGQVLPADVSLWAWVMTPYLGWKGSTRHKFISDSTKPTVGTITRLCGGSFEETNRLLTDAEDINIGWEGSTTGFVTRQNAEAVIPWYSNMRFRNCRIGNPDISFEQAPAYVASLSSYNGESFVRQIAAAGEDYSLYFWVSTPIVTIYDT